MRFTCPRFACFIDIRVSARPGATKSGMGYCSRNISYEILIELGRAESGLGQGFRASNLYVQRKKAPRTLMGVCSEPRHLGGISLLCFQPRVLKAR